MLKNKRGFVDCRGNLADEPSTLRSLNLIPLSYQDVITLIMPCHG